MRLAPSSLRAALGAALTLAGLVMPVHAQSSLAAPLCGVLTQLLPEVKGYQPAGARAQLVMAVFDKLDGDNAKLRVAYNDIDKLTTASCPKERDAMLGIVKTKSLGEALR
jgi:hypothetical protein